MARGLLRMRAVLVLDEATANVDPDTDNMIQQMVRDHLKDCTGMLFGRPHNHTPQRCFLRVIMVDCAPQQ
jgi:ABC-type transport system involved in cytochrome bd biosynthesis fused ATPase/permease subunit